MNCVELIFWTVLICLNTAEAGMMGDQCDWTGSGLSSPERGVRPVYVRCGEGALRWLYPRGALRLQFAPPLPPADTEFRVCVRLLRRPDPPDIFPPGRLNDTEPPRAWRRFPARLFVEGAGRLLPLYAADDGDPRHVRCFRSRAGRAALYVEAEPENGVERRVAELVYEARALPRAHYDPAAADCTPCTDDHLELAFCTSDLVSRAHIIGTEHREDLDMTRLTVELTKLIRATGGESTVGGSVEVDIENELPEARKRLVYNTDLHAHVHVASVCGASAGAGEFMVMARRRLGRLTLVCAPRIDDWVALVKRRNADGNAHCVLQY